MTDGDAPVDGQRRRAILAIAVAAVVKTALAARWGYTADIKQTLQQAEAFLDGRSLFDPANTGGNPSFFLPGHFLLAAACLLGSRATGLDFAFVVKIPAIAADAAVALLLMTAPRGGPRLSLLYTFSPLTFLLAVYHGQFHTVATAALVAALTVADRTRWTRAGLALGIAGALRQHFFVLAAPLLAAAAMRTRDRKAARAFLIGLGVVAIPIALSLLATTDRPARVLAPVASVGTWGYGILVQQGPRLAALLVPGLDPQARLVRDGLTAAHPVLHILWAAGFAAWTLARPRAAGADPWHAALLYLLGTYVISPGLGVQWLVWAFPLWLIVDARSGVRYGLLAGAFVGASYWQYTLNRRYHLPSITARLDVLATSDLAGLVLVGALGVAAWAYCAASFVRLARSGQREPSC